MDLWTILGIVLLCLIGTIGTAVHKWHEHEVHKRYRVPRVGEKLHFWDDGKSSDSRHYLAVVTHVLTPEETKLLYYRAKEVSEVQGELCETFLDAWKVCVKEANWLFAEETDYFIGCSIPEYDDHIIWFARTKDGGWFSIVLQDSWQGGRLDTTGEIYERRVDEGHEYSTRL